MKCKILMALMTFDIGGAETHVAELSKELKKRGYEIVIASAGGAYEEELEKVGIKHYTLPLKSRKPSDMSKCRKEFEKILFAEKIDIVHSHARISSYILGKLRKKIKFPFVTTAHGIYATSFGRKRLTNWGQKMLAVSDDIKNHLIDVYKINPDDITITVNGIDTERFSKNVDSTNAVKEFGISQEDNVIVNVSRMDTGADLIAYQLIESVRKLDGIIENLKCIIVGGGNDFENVKIKADELNKELGREAIIMAGARVNVEEMIAPAKLFVGVSRAALEAMACEKPSIIAGNQGYLGLFNKENTEDCLLTNFCCRGFEVSDTDKLAQQIGEFFGLWDDEQKELGEYARKVVVDNYSITRMADDAEKLYKECFKLYNR